MVLYFLLITIFYRHSSYIHLSFSCSVFVFQSLKCYREAIVLTDHSTNHFMMKTDGITLISVHPENQKSTNETTSFRKISDSGKDLDIP